jgi:hypothetical protein
MKLDFIMFAFFIVVVVATDDEDDPSKPQIKRVHHPRFDLMERNTRNKSKHLNENYLI